MLKNPPGRLVTLAALLLPISSGSAAPRCLEEVGKLVGVSATRHAFLDTLAKPVVLHGPPPSRAIQRVGILLEASGKITSRLENADPGARQLRITPGEGGVRTYDRIKYIEFPNSTAMETTDPRTGKVRQWVLARGVRQYSTVVDLKSGTQSPQGYLSDVLLFEVEGGQARYRSRLITSIEESKFFFEDPRVSSLTTPDGRTRLILSGTDYSPHLPGATDPDVMNRYVELELDPRGVPQAPPLNAAGRPAFANVSPFPKLSGSILQATDAKNATFAYNELNQLVVRTRLRPDFKGTEIQALAGSESWKYAEQVFVFKDWEEMTRYDWDHCLEDLFAKPGAAPERVRPLVAKTIIRDAQLRENFTDPRLVPAKGKGLGPGTPPVRVVRRGDSLFVSGGKNAPEKFAGKVSASFALAENDPKYITFDHEIRYFMDSRAGHDFIKRHYSMSIKQFDASLTRIERYYADALQPETPHELGHQTGIVDLQHVYPMGWHIVTGKDGVARVRVTLGVSDAHTEIVEVDLAKMIQEMAPGSARERSGQVYRP